MYYSIRQRKLRPNSWPEKFSDCGGTQQSPIDIYTENLKRRKTKKPLKWTKYKKIPNQVIIENSGHSIHARGVWTNFSDTPYVTSGPLEKRYFFSQLHFHWGIDSSRGSEHTVNHKRFPLEMHVVHDSSMEDDSNVSEERNDDLVVVSFMFEVVKNDNLNINPILEGALKVRGSIEKSTNVKPFSFESLIDSFQGDYVSYKGSLTTPPCTEGVIWIIYSKPLGISERQLSVFRTSVVGENGSPIRNYRPIQDLNSRNVYYVFC